MGKREGRGKEEKGMEEEGKGDKMGMGMREKKESGRSRT